MNTKEILVIQTLAGIVATSCSVNEPSRPNVLFILADDLGITDLGCYGSSFNETPNLDALASDAVLFNNAYAACSVSSPTRASLMTGKYPARVGITDWIPGRQSNKGANDPFSLVPPEFTLNLPASEYTIADAFKDNGYQTLFVGKWHLGKEQASSPENQGFDVNVAGGEYGRPINGYFSPYGLPNLEDGPEGEYLTERLADECIKLLDKADKKKPFFMYYSLYQVHTPLQAKQDKIDYFAKKADSLSLTFGNSTTTDRKWISEMPVRGNFKERYRQGNPIYAAMVSHMDDAIGQVIGKLKELGVYDNTIIIFTSDNGGLATAEGSPTSNLPYRAGKGWAYEGGVREPLIVRWPGVSKNGSVNESVVTSPDFYPTLMDMVGCKQVPSQHLDGVSFAKALSENTVVDRGPVFWHYPHYSNQGGRPCGAVRFGNYKLIRHYEDMDVELFDLDSDVSETKDISDTDPGKTAQLEKMLNEWLAEVGADMPVKK